MRADTRRVLIFLRHGQSTANADGLLAGRTNVSLTNRGREQSRAVALVLRGVQLAFTSPLERTVDTAQLALPLLVAIRDDAFIEQDYGTLDGTKMSDVPRDEWKVFQSSHEFALGGGESTASVDERVKDRLESIFHEHRDLVRSAHEHIVVVSHVAPIKSAVTWALGVSGATSWRLRLDNASLTTIGQREHRGPYLVTYNDVSAWSSKNI